MDPAIATGKNAISAGNASGPPPPPTIPECNGLDSTDEDHDEHNNESDAKKSQNPVLLPIPSTPMSSTSSSTTPDVSLSSASHSTYGIKRKHNSGVSSSSALDHLADNVGNLISTLQEPQSTSPACKNAAWNVIMEEEDLSDTELAAARKIFRGRAELADEYLSFPPHKKRARTMWL